MLALLAGSCALRSTPVDLRTRKVHVLTEEADDYGARLWGCSIGMARWLVEDASLDMSGTRVLELGAGTGLVSLSLAAVGAQVVATDISPPALRLITAASEEQGLSVSAHHFDVTDRAAPLPGTFDLLVASDVLYTPKLAEALARRCVEALECGAYVVVGEPGRPDALAAFFEALEEQNAVLPRVRSSWVDGASDWLAGIQDEALRRPKSERLLVLHFEARNDPFRCATHGAE